MSFAELFNAYKKDELIRLHKKRIMSNFQSAILQLEAIQNDKCGVCDNQLRGWIRLTMGYRGIGFNNGVYSNLKTLDSINKNNKELTFDHVVGATLCGETVKNIVEKENFNLSYLTKNWLFDNLYLWGTVKLTKHQHKKDNILRNKNSLSEKLHLKHYLNLSLDDLIVDKK